MLIILCILKKVKGVEFYAHSLVLCSVSSVLRKRFESVSKSNSDDFLQSNQRSCMDSIKIILDICEPCVFEVFLNALYSGRLMATYEDMPDLIELAQHLGCSLIIETCTEFLSKSITARNVNFILFLAKCFNMLSLFRSAQMVSKLLAPNSSSAHD
jgi:hypothetical protein